MSDAPEPRTQIQPLYPLGVVLVTGLLWWADGRLWASTAAYAHDSFWFVMMAQFVLGSWLRKSRFGQVFAVLLDGAFFWVGAQWAWGGIASGGAGRWIVLIGGGVTLALIFASVAWERFPAAWRARVAASRIARGVGICLIVATVGGFLWLEGDGSSTGNVLEELPWTVLAMLLALAGALALALWRLDGWKRVLACWVIASLAWVGLMTGLATGVPPGAVGAGGWLLAIVPPLIGGAVTTAYWRIQKTYRV
ncbi:hypothetical protein ASD38_17340 [Caulobacter sp. Root487D2Y]|uniref:hypothetical protein n=1 Tax=Caulobacter sp. Root487D2Y TaxID=1736547 RepID=UPI0006F36E1A|nr:hypothetical protein [Caulobacter sp. Root487D2Y]KQY27665.1 hypothetical protein ASD38_17340 [Caulobacter sp. Root487D2Y]